MRVVAGGSGKTCILNAKEVKVTFLVIQSPLHAHSNCLVNLWSLVYLRYTRFCYVMMGRHMATISIVHQLLLISKQNFTPRLPELPTGGLRLKSAHLVS